MILFSFVTENLFGKVTEPVSTKRRMDVRNLDKIFRRVYCTSEGKNKISVFQFVFVTKYKTKLAERLGYFFHGGISRLFFRMVQDNSFDGYAVSSANSVSQSR